MTNDKKQRWAQHIERARQHQEMRGKFTAYQDFIEWLNNKIAILDGKWQVLAIDNDALQQLRGQKQALLDVKGNLDAMLSMDIQEEMKKMEISASGEAQLT